ncbi:ABC transporter ATP-binding protein [Stomatohabitans albus]|uniref:ABC transporter ATP-binding protein n=1 Tax=Stomatohabitans albus TaxID=3110766 RepID=UPI00300C6ADC
MADFPLTVSHVSVYFGGYQALKDVSFQVSLGKILGIAGPNGSGKTTLLRTMFGAQPVAEGEIKLSGKPIAQLKTSQVGRELSVVAQFEHNIARMRVLDLVLLGRSPHRKDIQGFSRNDQEIAENVLAQVGMDTFKHRYFDTLSGGERQRVLIARGLAQACPCMLLDEPTNHLDIKYQHQILALLRNVISTGVIILHDLNLVSRYCDEVIVLSNGEIACRGHPQEVLTTRMVKETYGVDAIETHDEGVKQFIFRGEVSAARHM